MKHERRFQAGRPYYRPRNRWEIPARETWVTVIALSFVAGCVLGAVIALAWVDLTPDPDICRTHLQEQH